ncbi:MAG: hypothetical protein OXE96_08455 [Gemmatimonadetes bacterium]|nr:hypothetical protein [Gemmatimonadota bacterium]
MAWAVAALVVACENPQAPVSCGPIPQQTINVAEVASVTACFNDADGDVLSYAVSSSNESVAIATHGGTEVAVTARAPGSATIALTATDRDGLQAQQSFGVVVPNRPPRALGSIAARRVEVGQGVVIALAPWFEEPDGQSLTFRVAPADRAVAGVALSGDRVTLVALAKGTTNITATATDPGGLEAVQVFRFEVPNRGPVALGTIEGQVLRRGEQRTVDLTPWFNDPDGDPLVYAAAAASPSVVTATVSGATLRLTVVAAGETAVTVTARDPDGSAATHSFSAESLNRPPLPAGSMPDQAVRAGETARFDVSPYFTDPDGDPLTYTASSSDGAAASVEVFGATLELSGRQAGRAKITVAATDPSGLEATQSFQVTVEGPPEDPGSFRIDLRFATAMSATQEAAFRNAAARWMAVLADTELPDMPVPEGTVRCRFPERTYEQPVSVVDDLFIIAAVAELDGDGRILGRAGFCAVRSASQLPWFGIMELDAADLDWMETNGTLEAVILHEMAHVLGVGTLWDRLGLLRNPSLAAEAEVDTHFSGAQAARAFDGAGGASYTAGAKVPVENSGTRPGSDDAHWRKSVFGPELMGPSIAPGSSPLSRVTIASLADMGYAVRMDLADAFRLPGAAGVLAHQRRAIDLGNDVVRPRLEVRDRNGRVVKIEPGGR